MSTMTPLQRRAERKKRNQSMVDMNLVSLIDVFTILIFFLLSNSGIETLPSYKAVKLPESTAQKVPAETLVVTVSDNDILVEGRRVASVAEAAAQQGDLIAPLLAEMQLQASRKAVKPENQAQGPAVTIMADKSVPYSLLRKVMFTCARANFSNVSFAVRRKFG